MSYEHLGDLAHFQMAAVAIFMWLHRELTNSSFCTVKHWFDIVYKSTRSNIGGLYSLHSKSFPRPSKTRLEQFLVSVGPPPLVVPRKETVISRMLDVPFIRAGGVVWEYGRHRILGLQDTRPRRWANVLRVRRVEE